MKLLGVGKMNCYTSLPHIRILLIIICLTPVDVVRGSTSRNITLLFVTEERNIAANEAVKLAINYVSKIPGFGLTLDMHKVTISTQNPTGFLESVCKVYNNLLDLNTPPNLLMDTTISGLPSNTLKGLVAALAIPTVSTSPGYDGDFPHWRNVEANQKKYLVAVLPPTDIIPQIIRKIIIFQKIRNAAIIFDNNFVMDNKYKTLLLNVMCRHKITPIKGTTIKKQLQNLRNQDITNYFILGSLTTIEEVLSVAEKINFCKKQYSWYAITHEGANLTKTIVSCTFLFGRPVLNNNLDVKFRDDQVDNMFYLDLILRSFLAVGNMIVHNVWKNMSFIKCNEYNGGNSPARTNFDFRKYILEDTPDLYNYGKLHSTSNGAIFADFTLNLYAVTSINGSLKEVPLGYWIGGFDTDLRISDPKTMKNFTTPIVYRAVTVIQEPFVLKNASSPSGFSGYSIDFLDAMAKLGKFQYEISLVPDGKFGDLNKNGNWDGVVKELLEKRADIGLGSMSISAERETAVDFTVPYYASVGYSILMKRAQHETSLFQFLTVLENEVWFCMLGTYFFTSLIIWIFARWNPYSNTNTPRNHENNINKRVFTLKECLWFSMTSITPQGGGEAPINLSGRLVAATWWLFSFIIIASYTANLSAFLTVSHLDTPIKSLDDLSNQYKIQYAPLKGSAAMTYFKRMSDIEDRFFKVWKDISLNSSLSDIERAKLAVWEYPLSDKYKKLWQAMNNAVLPNTLKEAVQRVLGSKSSRDGFAFIGDTTDIRFLQLTNCDLQMVGKEFSKKPYAFAVQKYSPLKERLNKAILPLLRRFYTEELKLKWWKSNQTCKAINTGSHGISIENIGGVFIIILLGIVLSLMSVVLEYFWYMYKKSSNVVYIN